MEIHIRIVCLNNELCLQCSVVSSGQLTTSECVLRRNQVHRKIICHDFLFRCRKLHCSSDKIVKPKPHCEVAPVKRIFTNIDEEEANLTVRVTTFYLTQVVCINFIHKWCVSWQFYLLSVFLWKNCWEEVAEKNFVCFIFLFVHNVRTGIWYKFSRYTSCST